MALFVGFVVEFVDALVVLCPVEVPGNRLAKVVLFDEVTDTEHAISICIAVIRLFRMQTLGLFKD